MLLFSFSVSRGCTVDEAQSCFESVLGSGCPVEEQHGVQVISKGHVDNICDVAARMIVRLPSHCHSCSGSCWRESVEVAARKPYFTVRGRLWRGRGGSRHGLCSLLREGIPLPGPMRGKATTESGCLIPHLPVPSVLCAPLSLPSFVPADQEEA